MKREMAYDEKVMARCAQPTRYTFFLLNDVHGKACQ